MLSNVSLLYPQDWQVTLDRSFPPNILCTHVVSDIEGSSFLDEAFSVTVKRKCMNVVDPRWLPMETGFLEGVYCISQEFMRIFLATTLQVFGNDFRVILAPSSAYNMICTHYEVYSLLRKD